VCVAQAQEGRWIRGRAEGDEERRTIPNQHRAAGGFVGCCRLPPRRKLKVPLCLMGWIVAGTVREANRSGMNAFAGAENAAEVR
jgi:hypothetical protein